MRFNERHERLYKSLKAIENLLKYDERERRQTVMVIMEIVRNALERDEELKTNAMYLEASQR